jgi:hypothetical protein
MAVQLWPSFSSVDKPKESRTWRRICHHVGSGSGIFSEIMFLPDKECSWGKAAIPMLE